ncbi:MAG: tetratricopeptide repeat protein [Cyclobacteriaceae bacterium]
MPQNRLDQLLQLLSEDPLDPFLLYAVAIERMSAADPLAIACFEELLNLHPDYLPTYYTYAGLLAQQGADTKARTLLEAGSRLAQQQGNQKALNEIRQALNLLDDE